MRSCKRFFMLSVVVVLIAALCTLFAACGGNNDDDINNDDYEFVFTASSSDFDNGRTFNVTVYGMKDNTLSLQVTELKAAKLSGTWTFVENKGYKIYFNDTNGLFAYTAYDTTTKDFTFRYTLDIGEGYGSARMTFTYHDEAFADQYDGVGLGVTPPTFSGIGYSGGSATTECTNVLKCNEDGTVTMTSTYREDAYRDGTWTYDEDTNVYSFELGDMDSTGIGSRNQGEDESGKYYYKLIYGYGLSMNAYSEDKNTYGCSNDDLSDMTSSVSSVYDEETGIYTVTVVGVADSYVVFECTYEY